jgi:hypothetical protein
MMPLHGPLDANRADKNGAGFARDAGKRAF